ncbi:MAG TPA: glycine cleavage system protein H [Methanosarcinales archaeon]|nr:glycine cleavage system protein H [Methanosarcinales archaeon]
MKVEDFELPEDRLYLKNHVWVKPHGDRIRIGITELGQSLSKEIVHIDLPDVGDVIPKDDLLIAYETIKAVSQISLPFECSVVDVNDRLWDDPNLINSDPYKICMVEVSGDYRESGLMTAEDACAYYGELIEKERERYAGY